MPEQKMISRCKWATFITVLNSELTNQMNVYLSCHLAFLGRNALEPTYAMNPTARTPARENAEVLVNMVGASAMVSSCDDGTESRSSEKKWPLLPHSRVT